MISPQSNPWAAGFSEAHAPPKDQTVAEWCAENVYLANSPIGAKFQPGGYSDDILNYLTDPDVYEIAVVGHTGMGKSAILECAHCYVVAQAAGPTLTLGQTDKTVQEWAESRLLKALDSCEPVQPFMPKDRHAKKKMSIIFPHMDLFLGGANLTNTQEKSMRYTFGDEAWAWDHGILGQLLFRHHDRWNRKNMLLAQGGTEEDDWHVHTKNGLTFDRAFRCSCGYEQTYQWGQVKFQKATDGNGEPDWPEIFKSIFYECENAACQKKYPDTPRGRISLTETGFFKCRNNAHVPGRVTMIIPAMANPRIQMKSLVQKWIESEEAWKNGDREPRKEFVQKRLAQFWVEKVETPTLSTGGEKYSLAAFNDGEKWEGEFHRDMTVDVQKGHFWVRVRSWKVESGVKSRLLWAGRADTWQTLFSLRERFRVENRDVFIDGRYEIDEVVRQIYIHCGDPKWDLSRKGGDPFMDHWNILIGQDNDKGYRFNAGTAKRPKQVWRMFSNYSWMTTHRGQRFRAINFSNLKAKDALAGLMELADGTFGTPVDAPPYYVAQMASETKREIRPGVWRWEKIKSHFHNHLWDCETMGVVAASIRQIIRRDSED